MTKEIREEAKSILFDMLKDIIIEPTKDTAVTDAIVLSMKRASAIVAAIEALEQATDIKCEAKEKTCEICGYKGGRYISYACLTCYNYRRVHLEWKPKESEDKRINSLNNAIKHYEKLIKENEFLIKTNDSYNFSQLEWKKNVEEYSQLVKWLKELREFKKGESEEEECRRI